MIVLGMSPGLWFATTILPLSLMAVLWGWSRFYLRSDKKVRTDAEKSAGPSASVIAILEEHERLLMRQSEILKSVRRNEAAKAVS